MLSSVALRSSVVLNVPAKQYERDGSDVRSPLSSTRTGIILLVQHDRTLGAMHCNVESVSSLDPRRTILAPGAVYSRCAPPATAVFGSAFHTVYVTVVARIRNYQKMTQRAHLEESHVCSGALSRNQLKFWMVGFA